MPDGGIDEERRDEGGTVVIHHILRDCPNCFTREQRGGGGEVANGTRWIVACECRVGTVSICGNFDMANADASIADVREAA